ncbi:GAF domain-containing protein [Marinomonas algicola]|uniref:GAF domain-containing protein n=1 Tax=Marinomonas algicola TaxID=2773454 RepID=UPI00174943C8|nr:GAF domain-containing protein [Marinomonas algicola]
MDIPQVPDIEKNRLKSLRSLNILDSSAEERFDRITRMAKRIFNVPIVLVSLVDQNRQWFKSCIGLDVRETSRDISFCGHAILKDEVLVIKDASNDERFFDNPLVTHSPNIRFYAGCPVRSEDGYRLGTLCLIDQEPRAFSEEDIEALKDLANMVELELAVIHSLTTDDATKTLNKEGFTILAQDRLDSCLEADIPVAAITLKIDDFQSINDTFGSEEGKRILEMLTKFFNTESSDIELFGRLGDCTFIALLTNKSIDEMASLMQNLSDTFKNRERETYFKYEVTFTYDVVRFSSDVPCSIQAVIDESE